MWSTLPALLLPTALATDPVLFAGLPPGTLGEELPALRVQSARLGSTLDLPKGLLRLYVGPSEAAAQEWVADMALLMARHKPTPLPGLGDEAYGAADGMILLRDHNVGLLVEIADGARHWVDEVRAHLVTEPSAWPSPATLRAHDEGFLLEAPAAAHLTYVGGRLAQRSHAPGAPLVFQEPPRRAVAWDALGRSTVQDFDEAGNPVPTPQPRPSSPPEEAGPNSNADRP